jgi:hypothetical protein
MIHEQRNPAPLAKATGLGIVHWQGNDRDIALPLCEIQTNFIARRTSLSAVRARLVAELCFDRRAA